jgi:hypothetical protein
VPHADVATRAPAPLLWLSASCPPLRPDAGHARNRALQLEFSRAGEVRRRAPPLAVVARPLPTVVCAASRPIWIPWPRSGMTLGQAGPYRSSRPRRTFFAKETLCFVVSQVYPSAVQRSSRLGPFFYVLNPSISGFSTRGPALVFLHRSPLVFMCN